MSITLFLIVFGILSIGYLLLGFIASKNIKTTTDYFLAGRNLGLGAVTFTLIATQLGGGMLLGTAQEAYLVGLSGILYTLGMAIGFLLLGSGLASRMQQLQISTTAELFEKRYASSTLKQIASLLSVITLCGILVGQIVAAKGLLAGLGITNEFVFIGFWLFVIAYTMLGGLQAVVITDIFQVIFIIAVFTGIFLYSIWLDPSSLNALFASDNTNLFTTPAISESFLIGTLLMPILFSLIEQDLAQRFFAARSQRIAGGSALLAAGFLLLFSLIPIYFGMQAKLLNLPVAPGASPLMPVIEYFTNEFMVILALCGILAAITSTADSLLCAISSNIAQDFNVSWVGIKNEITLSQTLTCIIGMSALTASYFMPSNVITILVGSYEISVCCLFVPLIIAYFKQNLNKYAAYGAVIGGLSMFILVRLYYPLGIPRELMSLGTSAVGYWIGSMIKN